MITESSKSTTFPGELGGVLLSQTGLEKSTFTGTFLGLIVLWPSPYFLLLKLRPSIQGELSWSLGPRLVEEMT